MIDKISIVGLWEERNYRLELVDGSLIIVGENGSGKTTVLRIIYNVLSRNWLQLFEENFEEIELKSGEESININLEDMQGLEDYFINIRKDFQEGAVALAEKFSLATAPKIMLFGGAGCQRSLPSRLFCTFCAHFNRHLAMSDKVLDQMV